MKINDITPYIDINLKRKGLHEQIADQIQEFIISNNLNPGDRILPDRELAKVLNVSRPTVSEAMRLLYHRGLVDRRPGAGTYLIKMNPESLIEPIDRFFSLSDCSFSDWMQVRRLLEPEATAMAAQNANPEIIETLNQKLDLIDQALQCKDPNKFSMADSGFHVAVANASGNDLLAGILNGISYLNRKWMGLYKRHITDKENIQMHRKIFNAIQDKDEDLARKLSVIHLQRALEVFMDSESKIKSNKQ